MKGVKSMATCSIILLMTLFAFSIMSLGTVNAQAGETTVVMDAALGGTTDPAPGTYQMSGNIILTATADPGFEFAYWVYNGPDEPAAGGTIAKQWFDNPLSYNCAEGYTVEWQPVFVPTGSSSVPTVGISVAYVVAFVVIAAAVVGVAAFAVGRRTRK